MQKSKSVIGAYHSVKPSMVKASMQQGTDINAMYERAKKNALTDPVYHTAPRQPMFGDFRGIDYQNACNLVIEARQAFESLPVAIRDRFGNDPSRLMDFVSDGRNRDEAIRLGLIPKVVLKPVPEPILVKVVTEPIVEPKGRT